MTNILWFRRAFIVIVLLGLLGLGAELAAVGHWYNLGQLIPFTLIVLGIIAGLWFVAADSKAALWTARVVAALLILGGLFGALQHNEVEGELRQAGRQNALGTAPEPDAKPILGLPAPGDNILNGPAPLSAPLALSGLGLLLFLALHRREQDALGAALLNRVGTD